MAATQMDRLRHSRELTEQTRLAAAITGPGLQRQALNRWDERASHHQIAVELE
jgi:hypothetical protein